MFKRHSTRRRPVRQNGISLTIVLSIGLMCIAALSGVALLVDIAQSDSSRRIPRSSESAGGSGNSGDEAPSASADVAPEACPDLAGRITDTPKQEPSEITWKKFRFIWVPFSAASGPAREQGGVASCYARTPIGALIAAAQTATRATLAADWRQLAEKQFIPGPAADAFIRRLEQATRNAPVLREDPGMLQPAGFKILTYTPDQAMIALLYGTPGGTVYQVGVYSLIWQGGDWKINPGPDGKVEVMLHQPTTVDEYIPWGSP
jgi:hypothetical protein